MCVVAATLIYGSSDAALTVKHDRHIGRLVARAAQRINIKPHFVRAAPAPAPASSLSVCARRPDVASRR